jgi:hypothetical protein
MDEEQKDLSLDEEDAENVLGGTKKAKKAAKPAAHHTGAPSAIIVNAPPMNTSPDDHSVADAPQGDDPDC